MDAMA
jgi:hypothetical protein